MSNPDPIGKKGLGQHWLKDQASLEAICQAADVRAGNKVLEIGPGTGELTKVLVAKGAHVIALEYDDSLIVSLRQQFKDESVEVVQGDIRTFDLTKMPTDYKVVANIPYYLTANLLRLLVDSTNKPSMVSLLVQKEVAERVANQPGQMSFITVAVQLNYEVSLGDVVPAALFSPPPKVDSQILVLKRLETTLFGADFLQAVKFIKAGFSQPRKTLVNNLSGLPGCDRNLIESWLQKLDLKLTVRAQELSLEDWHQLYADFKV